MGGTGERAMQVVYTDTHLRHRPSKYFKAGSFHQHPECPERADSIVAAVRKAGFEVVDPEDYGPQPRATVHTPAYLKFLETAYDRWQELHPEIDQVMPNVHPGRHMRGHPVGIIGEAGYYVADMSSPIGPHTWTAACGSANAAVHATRAVLDGAREAYALCRPPGHHAFADMAGGFCFLNNIAIGVEYALRQVRRVAVIDVDVHHGNGTQGIFYQRAEVFTASLHADMADFYPYFAGYAHEQGEGPGRGRNMNLPLPFGTGDNAYLAALAEVLDTVRVFAPDIVFVALGLDGYENDPFRALRITTAGFNRIATAIGELGYPTVLVQEGGYNVPDLGTNLVSFLGGFEAGRR
jgi:acetoin utilization deacetylase AcuC-like enzyme